MALQRLKLAFPNLLPMGATVPIKAFQKAHVFTEKEQRGAAAFDHQKPRGRKGLATNKALLLHLCRLDAQQSERTDGRLLLAMEKTPPSIVPLHTRLSHVGNWFMPATVHKLSNVPICTEILGTTDSGDKSEKTILTNDVSQYKAAAYVQCDRSCIQKSAH